MTVPQLLLGISLFFCHFIADFTPLSTAWMLKAKRFGTPLFPIFCHALVHATLMAFVIELYMLYTRIGYNAFELKFTIVDALFLFQLLSHFIIDILKGKANLMLPKCRDQINYPYHFWMLFGADQFLHATVILSMIFPIIK